MIRITGIKLPFDHTEEDLRRKIVSMLRLRDADFRYEIIRQSPDARKKERCFVYTVDVSCREEKKTAARARNNNIMLTRKERYVFPGPGEEALSLRPVIAGSGPAGLFCALYLAEAGFRPVILERGDEALLRKEKVEAFWETGILDPESNIQFGEGGAGTFSDGKLNTLVKDPCGRNREVLKRFVSAGAPENILYLQKPHLGTDLLIRIVQNLRRQIEELGGEFHFRSCLTDLVLREGKLSGVMINGDTFLPAEVCVLAVGHSARDTFRMLYRHQVSMESKAFAVGLRVQHPQDMIDAAIYGADTGILKKRLGSAAYKLTHKCSNGRGVYSFCMCPGGYVVNASSEEGYLAVNGMSYHARDSVNANSAVVVTVSPEDFPEEGPLGGASLQQELEKKAWLLAHGDVPVQKYCDFKRSTATKEAGDVLPCIKGRWSYANVREILPEEINRCIIEGMEAFSGKIPDFNRDDALLCGVESRTSSPVRILRSAEMQSSIEGLYPCGEGAGYAGGITSAAMDGMRIAEAIAKRFFLKEQDAGIHGNGFMVN